jgi:hypothetical protein
VIQLDASRIAKQWANRIAKLQPADQQKVLAELGRKMPNMQRLVMQILSGMTPGQTAGQAEEQTKPMPQMKPPQRKGTV